MTPEAVYWHLWTDEDGVTHQTRCQFKGFAIEAFSPPSPPLAIDRLKMKASSVVVSILPPGLEADWHKNPRSQWIIPLSGRWYVESMDGTRIEMGPGEISFGEDQTARPDTDNRVGHLSGTVGNEPAVLLVVQIDDDPTTGNPGRF